MKIVGRAMPVLEADVFDEGAGSPSPLGRKPFGVMLEALDDLRPNEVYVATGGSFRYALWGELMSTRARYLRSAGAVLNGFVATGKVVVTEPNRRAVGDKLVYTADDAKYFLTGRSPSIFDAERGTVWGDSLTFYNHDDRVLVESKRSSPTITRARTTK